LQCYRPKVQVTVHQCAFDVLHHPKLNKGMDLTKVFTRKMLMIMRMTAWALLLATMHVSAKGLSQKLSLSAKQTSLEYLFKEIRKQTGYLFLYDKEVISQASPVTLSVKDQPLDKVLQQVFKDQPLVYTIMEKNILVKTKPEAPAEVAEWNTPPPQVTLNGLVLDGKTAEPVVGASIVVKGAKKGVSTNAKGEFSIRVEAGTTIQVSFVGYDPQEFSVKINGSMTFRLVPAVNAMQDMVLTGVYTRRKESFTGAAVTFTGDQLKQVTNQNILQALKVMDPSFVQLENTLMGSNPNALPDIQIRGVTSLPDLSGTYNGNPNQPLFILDGFETTLARIYDLDMNRVASITILKDAAAKAIYGSRAANGVVVVETKRPQAGKMRLTYNGDANINAPDLTSYDLTNAAEKLQVETDAGLYTSAYEPGTQFLMAQRNERVKAIASGVNTYWLSKPLRVGKGQKHAIALEGGDAFLRYGVDLAYNDITGVMKGSDRRTTSGTATLSYRVSNLQFRNLLTVSFNKADDSPYGNFSEYTRLNPYWAPTDYNGKIKRLLGTFQPNSLAQVEQTFNPLYNATLGTKNFSKYTEIVNNFYAEWTLSPRLKLISRFGFSQKQDDREDFYPANHTRFTGWTGDQFYKRGSYNINSGVSRYFKPDVTLNYNKQAGKSMILFNAGWNMMQNSYSSYGLAAQGFLNDRVDYISFARQYQENGRPTGTETTSREVGVLGSVNYSYDNKYLFDATLRRNGSSVYGSDNRWGNFWSVGAGWNVHNESFFQKNSLITMLRLRATLGYTGNQNFNPYQAMATYDYYTDVYYDNMVSAKLMALANNSLKWQQTREVNLGTDIQLLKNVNLRFDYFVNSSDKLLADLSLPTSTGFLSYRENVGAIESKGFDATISARVYNNPAKEAFVNIYASAAQNKTRIVRLNNALDAYNKKQDELLDENGNPSTKPRARYKGNPPLLYG
jgi:TonB-linked SusC/RagA family outer membrane protein